MKRRPFLKSLAMASGLTMASPLEVFAKNRKSSQFELPIVKPPRLRKGNTIGLVAPAGRISETLFERSKENLENLGFRIKYTERLFARHRSFAGDDKTRAQDLEEMFTDPEVRGIMCVRGGWGSARILPHLNFKVIKRNPKAFIGFSDITTLSYVFFAEAGLVTFHGVNSATSFNEYTTENFNKVLVHPSPNSHLYTADEERTESEYQTNVIKSGVATGRLVGGNLSIMVTALGTPYDIDTRGKLIFIEEVREEPYRIDRMLTHMRKAGKFDEAAGVVLGVFRGCHPRNEDSAGFSLQEVLYDRLHDLGIPVIYGMSFGHVVNKLTFPFGIRAELNTVHRRVTLLEEAVVAVN